MGKPQREAVKMWQGNGRDVKAATAKTDFNRTHVLPFLRNPTLYKPPFATFRLL